MEEKRIVAWARHRERPIHTALAARAMISLDQFYEVKDDYSSCQNMSDVRDDGLISAHQMTATES